MYVCMYICIYVGRYNTRLHGSIYSDPGLELLGSHYDQLLVFCLHKGDIWDQFGFSISWGWVRCQKRLLE